MQVSSNKHNKKFILTMIINKQIKNKTPSPIINKNVYRIYINI